jgi:hypothetical protein
MKVGARMYFDASLDEMDYFSWIDLAALYSSAIEFHDKLAAGSQREQLGRSRAKVRHRNKAIPLVSRQGRKPRPDTLGV